ncbi:MAG TPA: hypothetical protein VGK76_03715 [Candidatus Eisenbacteria bacterium]
MIAGRSTALRSGFLAFILFEIMLLACGSACHAGTQDSTATTPPPRQAAPSGRTGEEQDRFELGIGAVQGFFDVTGSFAYRRFLNERGPFERSVMGELTGTTKSQLSEGIVSIYVLFRPPATYRQSWRIRPLLEFGPGVHTVVQVASLEGFNRSSYKGKLYVKSHAYAGVELLATKRLGFLVRGRMSAPSHHPFDYAQAAVFLR